MKLDLKYICEKNKIKLILASVLFAILILSFFFASGIEKFLNLDNTLLENQVTKDVVAQSNFKVSYIDVGQGNSSYIRLPDEKILIIDGGDIDYGEKVAKVLKDDGVTKIDFMIATHADSDHIAGLNFLLNEFEVKKIFRPFQIAGTGTNIDNFVVYEDEDLGDFYQYISEIEHEKTKISRVTTSVYKNFITNIYNEYYYENDIFYHSEVEVFYDGLKVVGDNYCIEFFAPLVRDENYDLSLYSSTLGFATIGYGIDNSNDNSAVILITIYDFKFLFTGDSAWTNNLYKEDNPNHFGETDFVFSLSEEEKLKFKNVSVFLLGHHGSSFSSGEELLKLIDADFFVVSAGKDNSYGHPNEDTIARITDYKKSKDYLLKTMDCGTITFCSSNNKLVYALSNFDEERDLAISWYLLGSIIYVFTIFVIFSLQTKKPNKQKN